MKITVVGLKRSTGTSKAGNKYDFINLHGVGTLQIQNGVGHEVFQKTVDTSKIDECIAHSDLKTYADLVGKKLDIDLYESSSGRTFVSGISLI